jgi:hypothetical protein
LFEERLRKGHVVEPTRLDGQIELAEYGPGWPNQFEVHPVQIENALGEQLR